MTERTTATSSMLKCHAMDLEDGLKVRVGTVGDGGRGDVLYLHGYADRLDNHYPLFDAFVAEGLRVISFDYPSHGETVGRPLNEYTFEKLAALAGRVEREEAPTGNLYLAGWSTGGLLAVRLAQGLLRDALSRPIAGMALFAPGVAVRVVKVVSEATLTRNPKPPHIAEPKPRTTAETAPFPLVLAANATLAGAQQLPSSIPSLVIVGGDKEDKYANTGGVMKWVKAQRRGGAQIVGLQCSGAFHELDNEPDPMGRIVRDAAARFLSSQGATTIQLEDQCRSF